ncbi:MAG: molecular chaperone DnaK [Patescibacteria group bacterium]
MSIVLGIDLGTTNSAMAYVVGGKPSIIENAEGARTTPSSFFYNAKDGSVVIGEIAKRNSLLNPEDTFYEVKRFIGRSFEDSEVQSDSKLIPYKVISSGNKVKLTTKAGKEFSPEEVSAAVLRKLKNDAEAKLGQSISEAVITVPAYFNDAQRQATKDAGEIAGLKVLRIINEPTAAALAYGFEKGNDEKVLVYDLGGGTFDVTVLDISNETIEVLATNGDTHLGGKDFDKAIIEHIIAEFKKDTGVDLINDKAAKQRIKEAAEKAKHDLSTQSEHQINLPFITMGADNQPQHLLITITRAKLEELVGDLIKKTMEPVKKALTDAGLDKGQINEILMVGGMTRMPLVQKTVEEFFGKKPNLTVNPDEVVAMGAAIQGAVLKGDVKDILLLDVTPLTLAIETAGSVATAMIPRNTTIPTSKSQIFSTAADGQTAVDVHVVQGERPLAVDNKSLGKFTLSGIPPAPRGVPQIEVTFDLDANGILTVTAVDKGTSKKANITITGSSTLSEEEKQQAIDEAERQKDADLAKKAKIDARNNAEAIIFQSDKLIKDMGDKLSSEDKDELTKLKGDLEELIKKEDASKEDIESKAKELQDKLMKVGEKIYSTADASSSTADQSQAEPDSGQTETESKTEQTPPVEDVEAKPKDE